MSKQENHFKTPDGGEKHLVPEQKIPSSDVKSKKRLLLYSLLVATLMLLIAVAVTLGVMLSRADDDADERTTVSPTTGPLTLTVVSFDNATISVRWEPGVSLPVSKYELMVSPPPRSGPNIIITEPDVDGAIFTGLISGTSHVITLEAHGANMPKSRIEQYTSPNMPTNLQFDDRQFPNLFILHWAQPAHGSVELYHVYQYTDYHYPSHPTTSPQPRKLLFKIPNNGNLTAPVTGLDWGIFYRWDVMSVVGDYGDIESEPVSVYYASSRK